jgi:hypothetical protein
LFLGPGGGTIVVTKSILDRQLAEDWPRDDLAADSSPRRRRYVKGHVMARALLGHLPTAPDRYLVEEVARLKGRVRELEAEVAELRAAQDSAQLLDELHRITSTESALA